MVPGSGPGLGSLQNSGNPLLLLSSVAAGPSPLCGVGPFNSHGEKVVYPAPEEASFSGGSQGTKQKEDHCLGPLSMPTLCPLLGLIMTTTHTAGSSWSSASCPWVGHEHYAGGPHLHCSPSPPLTQGFVLHTAAWAMLPHGRTDHNTPLLKILQGLLLALKKSISSPP